MQTLEFLLIAVHLFFLYILKHVLMLKWRLERRDQSLKLLFWRRITTPNGLFLQWSYHRKNWREYIFQWGAMLLKTPFNWIEFIFIISYPHKYYYKVNWRYFWCIKSYFFYLDTLNKALQRDGLYAKRGMRLFNLIYCTLLPVFTLIICNVCFWNKSVL